MDGEYLVLVRHGPVCSICGLVISVHLWKLLPTASRTVTTTTTTTDNLKRRKFNPYAVVGVIFGNNIPINQFADGSLWAIGKLSASLWRKCSRIGLKNCLCWARFLVACKINLQTFILGIGSLLSGSNISNGSKLIVRHILCTWMNCPFNIREENCTNGLGLMFLSRLKFAVESVEVGYFSTFGWI